MEKAYKFRIYPNATQRLQMKKTFGCCRYVWNHYLERRKKVFEETGETLNYVKCAKELTVLKKELPWLREADSTALQSSLRALDRAFQNFFRRCKEGGSPGYPLFKNKHDRRQSFVTKKNKNTIRVLSGHIVLPKLGPVKCHISRPVQGRIINAAVELSASGKYFVSLCCTDVPVGVYEPSDKAVGLDMGLSAFAVTSDGEKYANPKHLEKSLKKLARLRRQLSRKTKGSRRRNKARIRVARLHEHVRNQRLDTQQKLSTRLVKEYGVICAEDLAVGNMVKNHHLARAIESAAWSQFLRLLEQKSRAHGRKFQKVDRYFSSSQLCSHCGHKEDGVKNLQIHRWTCPVCGTTHDRDVNAAKNILIEGLRLIA